MDKELEDILIEYRRKRMSIRKIAPLVGLSEKTVHRRLQELEKEGKLNQKIDYKAREQKAYELYKSGMTIREIGEAIGVSTGAAQKIVEKLRKTTDLQPRPRKKAEPKAKVPAKNKKGAEITINKDGVRCTRKVAKSCRFGFEGATGDDSPKCNFMGCTGVARISISPDCKDCHVYQPISRENPRHKSLNEYNPKIKRNAH